jgi:hypothetical protein
MSKHNFCFEAEGVLQIIAHTYGNVIDIRLQNHISLWAKYRYKEGES